MVHVDSCLQELDLRPSQHRGSTFINVHGHPLDHIATATSPARCSSRSSSKCSSRRSSSKTSSRNSSKNDEKGQVCGPEHFFYDKDTYTGVHRYGGPPKGTEGSSLQLRPSMHLESSLGDSRHLRASNISRGRRQLDMVESIVERSSTSPHTAEQWEMRRSRSLGATGHLSSTNSRRTFAVHASSHSSGRKSPGLVHNLL